jgi:hypothetical protein
VSLVKYPVTVTGGPSLQKYGLKGNPQYCWLNQLDGGPASNDENDAMVIVDDSVVVVLDVRLMVVSCICVT